MNSKANHSGYQNSNDYKPDQLPNIDSEPLIKQKSSVNPEYFNQFEGPVESVGQILQKNSNQNYSDYSAQPQKTTKYLTNRNIIIASIISGFITAVIIIVIAQIVSSQ